MSTNYHRLFLTLVWLLSTSGPTHLLTQFSTGPCVRKEAECVEGAVRPGALRVRDALNVACKKQQQGGAKAGAVS